MEHMWNEKLADYRGTFFEGEWPTITQAFLITHSKFPDKPCFTTFSPDRISYTFDEIYQRLLKISSYLREHGLKKGDKVVINGKNSIEWALSYLAINFAGGVVVPLDNQLHTQRIVQLCQFSDASFIFADKNVLLSIEKRSSETPFFHARNFYIAGKR